MKNIICSSIFLLFLVQASYAQTERKHVDFEPGDLVVSTTGRLADGELDKAAEPYAENIVGVFTEGAGMSKMPGILQNGIAYIKFDPSNGEVKVGDYITSSSKTGYGMKATKPGVVVGVALETSGTGLLKIRIQPGWMKP